MGEANRLFKRLKDTFEVVSQEDFYLSDIFPPDKCTQKKEDLQPPKFPKPKTKAPNIVYPNRELQRTIQKMREGITRVTDEWVAEHSKYVVEVLTPDIAQEDKPIDIDINNYWDFGTGMT